MNRLCWLLFPPTIACLLWAAPAYANDSQSDGAYGRLDSIYTTAMSSGVWYHRGSVSPVLEVSGHHMSTTGMFLAITFPEVHSPTLTHSPHALLGVSLRPLFLPRFFKNWEHGPAWLDLTIDSVELELASAFTLRAPTPLTPGLYAGAAIAFPLQPRSQGWWIRLRSGGSWGLTPPRASTPDTSSSFVASLSIQYSFAP